MLYISSRKQFMSYHVSHCYCAHCDISHLTAEWSTCRQSSRWSVVSCWPCRNTVIWKM